MQLIRLPLAVPASIAGYVSSIAAVLHVSQTPHPGLPFHDMSPMKGTTQPHTVFLNPQPYNPEETQATPQAVEKAEDEKKDYVPGPHQAVGLSRPAYALIFGILSGLSLPIGATLGIHFSPVKEHYCAAMMAFGAGCLLFAVTVELYAHSLHELTHGRIGYLEMAFQTGGAVFGAYFYTWMNRWLETAFEHHEHDEANHTGSFSRCCSTVSEGGGRVTRIFTKHFYQEILKLKGPNTRVLTGKEKAQQHWANLRSAWRLRRLLDYWQAVTLDLHGLRGREIGMRVLANQLSHSKTTEEAAEAKMVALALFLGLLVDGVPEGVLVGFLAAEGHFSPVLIISLLLANFPEAFSSASLMITAGMSTPIIVSMWSGLCVLVGSLSGLSCWILLELYPYFGLPGVKLPQEVLIGISLVEGITGGAMIACISSVMLPEAFERTKKDGPLGLSSGFLCTVGFLVATVMKALGG